MIRRITSRSNQRVKDLLKKKDQYLFFEGEKLVNDILQMELPVETLILTEENEDNYKLPSKTKIKETWVVNESVMKKISDLKEKPTFIAVLKPYKDKISFKKTQAVIALDNIQDPANGGTVFRCASAFGIDSIAFSGASVKPSNPKFLRAAQNAFFDIHFQYFESTDPLIKKAENAGMNIYLTSSHSPGKTVTPEDIRFPCLILLGNEGRGLPEELMYQYPSIEIEQTENVESLNVGVSACIIMHELKKLSGKSKKGKKKQKKEKPHS